MHIPVEKVNLAPGERLDDLGGGLKIIQSRDVFAFGSDSILLSKFATIYNNDRVLDLGSGTGAISLLLSQRRQARLITALEIQPLLVDMMRRTVNLNNLASIIDVKQGDIREVRQIFPPESYDLVVANPPYMPVSQSQINLRQPVAIARHELSCSLQDVISAFSWLVRYGGKAAIVHRPHRLVDIFTLMRQHNLEPKRIQLVAASGKTPVFVLVEGEKGAKSGLEVLPFLVLSGGEDSVRDSLYMSDPSG